MASTSTKAVSFRVPVDSYVKLLEEAKNMGSNMTDLLFLRIFSQSNSPLDAYKKEAEEKIQALENELSTHKQQIEDLENENETLRLALNTATIHKEESTQEYEGVLGNFSQKQEEYEYKINQLLEQRRKAQALSDEAERRVMGLMSRNRNLEEACDNYEQEVTLLKQSHMEQKDEIDALQEALKNYEFANDDVEQKNKNLNKDMSVLSKKYEQAKISADKEAKEADNIIKRLTTRLTKIESENTWYKNEMDSLKEKNEVFKRNVQNKFSELYDRHNQQIDQLKDVVSGWLLYSSKDDQMFQNCKWEKN